MDKLWSLVFVWPQDEDMMETDEGEQLPVAAWLASSAHLLRKLRSKIASVVCKSQGRQENAEQLLR